MAVCVMVAKVSPPELFYVIVNPIYSRNKWVFQV